MLVIGDSTSTPDYGETVSSHTRTFFRIIPTRCRTKNIDFIIYTHDWGTRMSCVLRSPAAYGEIKCNCPSSDHQVT